MNDQRQSFLRSLYSLSRALMRNKWIKWFSDLLMQPQASQAHVVMLPNEALILKGKLHLTELPKRKRSLKKLWPRWNTNNVYLVIIMCPGVRNTSKHEFTSDFSLCNFVIALPLKGKLFNSLFLHLHIESDLEEQRMFMIFSRFPW